MATAIYEEADDRGSTPTRRSTPSRRRSGAAAALNSAALFDIVERLGVIDMVIDRLKGRLEEVDIDDLLDQAGDYLKRNPEVLVVTLGAITIAAGALVYLNKRREDEEDDYRPATAQRTQQRTKSRSRSNTSR